MKTAKEFLSLSSSYPNWAESFYGTIETLPLSKEEEQNTKQILENVFPHVLFEKDTLANVTISIFGKETNGYGHENACNAVTDLLGLKITSGEIRYTDDANVWRILFTDEGTVHVQTGHIVFTDTKKADCDIYALVRNGQVSKTWELDKDALAPIRALLEAQPMGKEG